MCKIARFSWLRLGQNGFCEPNLLSSSRVLGADLSRFAEVFTVAPWSSQRAEVAGRSILNQKFTS